MSIYDTPEFLADAYDDLADVYAEQFKPVAPYVAPVPAGFFAVYIRNREALAADLGFLAIVAPDLFAWRVGGTSVAQHHATGRPTAVADQAAARRDRRHREYRDGLRVRPLSEVQ